MDALDLRLLRAMFATGMPGGAGPDGLKPAALADALGVSAPTVRERLQRMEASGAIERYALRPSLAALGLAGSAFLVTVGESRKAEVKPRLEGLEAVGGYLDFFGGEMLVVTPWRDPADKEARLRVVERLVDARPHTELERFPLAQTKRALDAKDWRLVQALAPDARRPLAEVAEEMRLTAKSVKTRFDRLVAERAVVVFPVLDRARLDGVLAAHLVVRLAPGAKAHGVANALVAALGESVLFGWIPSRSDFSVFDVVVAASSPAGIEARREAATRVAGVASVAALVPCGGYDNEEGLAAEVARRAKAAE